MVVKTSDKWHGCPVRFASAVLGDPWNLLILRDLMFKDARHYADFLTAGEGISTNVLAARLVGLEAEGIVEKSPDPDHGSRYIYRLTDKGLGLVPVMLEIIDWSELWDGRTEVTSHFAEDLRRDRKALAAKIIGELEAQRPVAAHDSIWQERE